MTEQEVFDTVLQQTRANGYRRAVNERGEPLIRGDGVLSPLGMLIPPTLYVDSMNRPAITVMEVLSKFSGIGRHFSGVRLELLHALELVHDDAPSENYAQLFEAEMSGLAAALGLVYLPPAAAAER